MQQAVDASPKSAAPQSLVAQVPVSSLMVVPVQTPLVVSELQTLATALHALSDTAVLAAASVAPLSGQLADASLTVDASLAVHATTSVKVDPALPAAVGQVKAASSSATADVQA